MQSSSVLLQLVRQADPAALHVKGEQLTVLA
jgi:hypothetical protein